MEYCNGGHMTTRKEASEILSVHPALTVITGGENLYCAERHSLTKMYADRHE